MLQLKLAQFWRWKKKEKPPHYISLVFIVTHYNGKALFCLQTIFYAASSNIISVATAGYYHGNSNYRSWRPEHMKRTAREIFCDISQPRHLSPLDLSLVLTALLFVFSSCRLLLDRLIYVSRRFSRVCDTSTTRMLPIFPCICWFSIQPTHHTLKLRKYNT